MAEHQDIDFIFREWPYQPGVISARLIQAHDGRDVLQMRIEMGIVQMEVAGRPDGEKPGGADTYLDQIRKTLGEKELLSEEQCLEIDREFLQYYQRRICCMALRQFDQAVSDANHTLALMDFVVGHSPEEEWTLAHEQYRPFVLFHRTQAAAMAVLDKGGADMAIEEINAGLDLIRKIFVGMEAEEQFNDDELVGQLNELKESLRKEYHLGKTLAEQLSDAIAAEEYERAARIRDEMVRKGRFPKH